MPTYMNAKEACDYLGITAATLYTYVSRGLIRSEATSKDHRIRCPRPTSATRNTDRWLNGDS